MNPQFQDARIEVNKGHALSKHLPSKWVLKDEWYSFSTNPRAAGASVVLSLDESSYSLGGMGDGDLRMGDHPIAWTNCNSEGRMFYSAIGHMPESYSNDHYLALLESAIQWAADRTSLDCTPSPEAE